MPITIRPLTPSDHAVWEPLLDAYAAFYKLSPTAESKAVVWHWIFEEGNAFWGDLAWDLHGNAVGLVQYQLMHRSLAGEMVIYLSDLFVTPDMRGGGVGRALINHVISFGRARGISNVRWLTQEFNYAGRRLYDSYKPKTDLTLYSVPIER